MFTPRANLSGETGLEAHSMTGDFTVKVTSVGQNSRGRTDVEVTVLRVDPGALPTRKNAKSVREVVRTRCASVHFGKKREVVRDAIHESLQEAVKLNGGRPVPVYSARTWLPEVRQALEKMSRNFVWRAEGECFKPVLPHEETDLVRDKLAGEADTIRGVA